MGGSAADVTRGTKIGTFVSTPFRYKQMDLENCFTIPLAQAVEPFKDFTRSPDALHPGYYFMSPADDSVSSDSLDKIYIDRLLKKYMSPLYYDPEIAAYTENYDLERYNRREYYFVVNINNNKVIVSGWYGWLMHIIILTDYDSKDGFLNMTNEFFTVDKLDINKVEYIPSDDSGSPTDFIYKYIDSANRFEIYGYPHLNSSEVGGHYNYMVLDLTIYTKEQHDDE